MNISRILVALVSLGFLGSAVGAELLLTDDGLSKSRSAGKMVALDVVSNGDLSGFDFIIPVPKGAKVDTSKCLSALPAGFEGRCKHNEGEIAVIAISMNAKALPAGVHSIGSIAISGADFSARTNVKFNAVGADASVLNSSVGLNAPGNSNDGRSVKTR
ncbi:hypothetical protein [Denitratimonas sp. CY0512]|uniref:hypothetical protein n=1 Tax=Denitratimonas sp. CY0512 TaxID=3131940 RepID=UPI0030949CAF